MGRPLAEALKQRKEDIGKEIIEAQKLLDDAHRTGTVSKAAMTALDANDAAKPTP